MCSTGLFTAVRADYEGVISNPISNIVKPSSICTFSLTHVKQYSWVGFHSEYFDMRLPCYCNNKPKRCNYLSLIESRKEKRFCNRNPLKIAPVYKKGTGAIIVKFRSTSYRPNQRYFSFIYQGECAYIYNLLMMACLKHKQTIFCLKCAKRAL